MGIKISKDSEGGPQRGAAEEKGKQNVLLVVLLILVACFGYIYFFTGLIKPTPEQKVAEAPPVPQVVKKPLPTADGEPAKVAAAGGEEKGDAASQAKPEPAKTAPAPAPVVKPADKVAAAPASEVKKNEAPQSSVKKPLPVAAKAGEKKSAPLEKKEPAVAEKKQVAAAEKKALPAKDNEKKVADVKKPVEKTSVAAVVPPLPKKDAAKPAKKEAAVAGEAVVAGRWTVLVGNYVLEEAMAADLGRVRSAGLEAFVVPGAHKKTHMNRLLLADFTDRASAQKELDKLKRVTSDAFILDSAAMHSVYAGSYLLDSRAASEKERLAAAGFVLTLKHADVAIPSKNLTAGSFTDKKAAEDVLKKLRAAGVKATLSH